MASSRFGPPREHSQISAPVSRRELLSCAVALAGGLSWLAATHRGNAGEATATEPAGVVTIERFAATGRSEGRAQLHKVVKSDADWRAQLSAASYQVARHAATEPAFSGE